jgi:hypothetical protein
MAWSRSTATTSVSTSGTTTGGEVKCWGARVMVVGMQYQVIMCAVMGGWEYVYRFVVQVTMCEGVVEINGSKGYLDHFYSIHSITL